MANDNVLFLDLMIHFVDQRGYMEEFRKFINSEIASTPSERLSKKQFTLMIKGAHEYLGKDVEPEVKAYVLRPETVNDLLTKIYGSSTHEADTASEYPPEMFDQSHQEDK